VTQLNILTCPNCGQQCLTDCSYARCASCGLNYYASQSPRLGLPASPFAYPPARLLPGVTWPWGS